MIRHAVRFALIASVLLAACATPPERSETPPSPASPNIVFFVGDGFGVGAWSVGREWAKALGTELVMDGAVHVGFLDTPSADALVTDSAAAATAWSTSRPGMRLRVGDERDDPIAPLAQRVADAGGSFGFVTTARVTHATPAPFYGNVPDRYENEADLASQLLDAKPVVAIGGGTSFFLPKDAGGRRDDGRDLLVEAAERGIRVVTEWGAPLPNDGPVLAVLGGSHLPHEPDRGDGPDLAELVLAALDRLEAEGKPYFLMVEESRIDTACHDHDAPSLAGNVLRMDRALRAVLDRVDLTRTLVVQTADHATDNPTLTENARVDSFQVVTMSIDRMEKRIFDGERWRGTPRGLAERAEPVLDEGAGMTGLDPVTLDRLVVAESGYDRRTALGDAVSRRFGVVWMPYEDHLASRVVHGHTGDPVPVRAWGVRAAEVAGMRDHARFGAWLADVMGLPPVGVGRSLGPVDTAASGA